MNNPITEIASYLKHQDYSLAVRRMLDLSLDAGDVNLLNETIGWSREYHRNEKSTDNNTVSTSFLEQAEKILNHANAIYKIEATKPVELLNVSSIAKTYSRGNFSLKPISLQVGSGEIMGIVGENGNGKTTLLRCLAGQLALDKGYIDYRLLQRPDRYDVRKYIAFIPQRIPRWYGKLRDNLHFSASIAGVYGEENKQMVDFMLERLNLYDFAELSWTQISSGYRTRFEIARILLQKPKLLILDEPLANLDINAQQTILTDLRFIAKSAHSPMGIILSSQQLHEVEKIADTVLFIKQGDCLFRTNTTSSIAIGNVIEVETLATRESILAILGEESVQVQYNGGFYTITSTAYSPRQMIGKLLSQEIAVSYFRDITHSTKRFF